MYKINKYIYFMFHVEYRTSSKWIDLNKITRCSASKSCLQKMNETKPIKKVWNSPKWKMYMRNQSDSRYDLFEHSISIWKIPFEIFIYSSIRYKNNSRFSFDHLRSEDRFFSISTVSSLYKMLNNCYGEHFTWMQW